MNGDIAAQLVGKPYSDDSQIVFNQFYALSQGQYVRTAADGISQEFSQGSRDLKDLFFPVQGCQGFNGIQGIVQEVRVYLSL
jgi:hypothetical protein